MNRKPIPLRDRKVDWAVLGFFFFNLIVVTYIVDIEQNIIPDPYHFEYPVWPLPFMVDIIHWYGDTFDPVLMERPMWWRMTIWIDTLFFGPYYVFAIYAFIKGRDWIRIPTLIYASVMLTNVTIILGEEFGGPTPARVPFVVMLVNLPWLLVPSYLIYRMWRNEHPFTVPVAPEPQAVHEAISVPERELAA
jgi:hypothetical protein